MSGGLQEHSISVCRKNCLGTATYACKMEQEPKRVADLWVSMGTDVLLPSISIWKEKCEFRSVEPCPGKD